MASGKFHRCLDFLYFLSSDWYSPSIFLQTTRQSDLFLSHIDDTKANCIKLAQISTLDPHRSEPQAVLDCQQQSDGNFIPKLPQQQVVKTVHKEHPCIVVQSCTSSKGSSAALEGRRCAAVLFLLTEILENVQKFQKSMFWSPNKANAILQTGRLSHPHAHKQRVLRSWHFFVKKLECHTSHSAQNQTATADRARCSSDHCTGVGPRDVCMSQNSVHRQYARHEMTWNLRYSWTKTLLHQPTQYKNNKN